MLDHLDGICPLEEAVRILKTRHKTFCKAAASPDFKRERDVIWLNKPDFHYDETAILNAMLEHLKERGVLESMR